jgi:hypothetical protein
MNEEKQQKYAEEHRFELSDEDMTAIEVAFQCASRYVDGERSKDKDQQELDFDDPNSEAYETNEFGMGPEEPEEWK